MVAVEPQSWLRPLSWVYGLGARARNWTFEAGLRPVRRLPVPVVSVGNLSVGGTGKTPFVVWLVEHYRRAKLVPGVLSRGYGRTRADRLNDEGELLRRRFPDLPQAQDPDRYAAGRRLLAEHDVDLLVLDDGFQHRRLHRDLDICLVDAADPLGGGLLPSGWLREPASGIARADLCIVTGVHEVDPARRRATEDFLRRRTGDTPCHYCATRPEDVWEYPGATQHPVSDLEGRKCILLAGIARPQRFDRTVRRLGADVLECRFLRDHAPIDRELRDLEASAARRDAWLVTTEKDEARLGLAADAGPHRFVLRIGLAFEDEPPPEQLVPSGREG